MNSDNTQTAAVAMKCQGDVHIFNHPCTHCQCGRRIVTLPPGLDVTGPVTLSGPSALPDAPRAGGETPQRLDKIQGVNDVKCRQLHRSLWASERANVSVADVAWLVDSLRASLLARQRDGRETLQTVRTQVSLAKNEISHGSYQGEALRDVARCADFLGQALLTIDACMSAPSAERA